jgi:hypothetical protein
VRLKILALLAGALVASVAVVGVAEAGVVTKASSSLTARVLPKHINPTSIKKAKYKWTVRGNLTYGQYCPNGAKVFPYCETVPKNVACSGKVFWTAKIGKSNLVSKANKTIGSGGTTIKSNCTYTFSHTFPTSDFVSKAKLHDASSQRHVGVFFYVSFQGNADLKGSTARRQEVIAKVLDKG